MVRPKRAAVCFIQNSDNDPMTRLERDEYLARFEHSAHEATEFLRVRQSAFESSMKASVQAIDVQSVGSESSSEESLPSQVNTDEMDIEVGKRLFYMGFVIPEPRAMRDPWDLVSVTSSQVSSQQTPPHFAARNGLFSPSAGSNREHRVPPQPMDGNYPSNSQAEQPSSNGTTQKCCVIS